MLSQLRIVNGLMEIPDFRQFFLSLLQERLLSFSVGLRDALVGFLRPFDYLYLLICQFRFCFSTFLPRFDCLHVRKDQFPFLLCLFLFLLFFNRLELLLFLILRSSDASLSWWSSSLPDLIFCFHFLSLNLDVPIV